MSFKDYNIAISYKSVGEKTISDIINPLLKETKIYRRSVGFFSSSALNFISEGIEQLAKNGGHIYLATSPDLTEDDVNAILNGYNKRDMLCERFISEFKNSIAEFDDYKLNLLSELIEERILDIKIVKKKGCGMYHDKLAVLTDFNDNVVVFQGSNNDSQNGYHDNYEKVRVYKSWFDYEGRIDDELEEFNSIWSNSNDFLDVYEFDDAIKESIINIKNSHHSPSNNKPVFKLRPYQIEAKDAWVKNNYNGFFVMATGTGKTITALYSIKELLDIKNVFTVIAVPYKHLVEQWFEDATKILPNCKTIKVYGEVSNWDRCIITELFNNKYNKHTNIIAITTLKSFYSDRFQNVYNQVNTGKLLVVDEAHNYINYIDDEKYSFDYKLGLSATPVFGNDTSRTEKLLSYFGGRVYNLPIDKAIGKFLVDYEYHPLFVHPSEEEEKKFKQLTSRMASCFDKFGVLIDKNKYFTERKARLRVISMVEEKMTKLPQFIKEINRNDHFIVYCSDGKIYNNAGDQKRHITYVLDEMNKLGYKPSKFTAEENMQDRLSLIDNFNKGYISSLVAIRCLDEGINIPSIETALILSSNDNYREFVQRRGRILRKYADKKIAHIYDVIVLPSADTPGIAEIELRRYYEYAKLSIEPNRTLLLNKMSNLLSNYGLSLEDINYNNEFIEGEDLDE